MPYRAKKKSKYSVAPKKSSGSLLAKSTVNKQLSVIYNPYSTATTNPKIPDGLAYLSAGVRLQVASELTLPKERSIAHILVFPGLLNGMICYLSKSNDAKSVTSAFTYHYPYSLHATLSPTVVGGVPAIPGTLATSTAPAIAALPGVPGELGYKQSDDVRIAKWRLVSQGLRVALINNSDNNEGWWQAIRVNADDSQFMIDEVPPAGGVLKAVDKYTEWLPDAAESKLGKYTDALGNALPGGDHILQGLVENKIPGVDFTKELVEHPTYQSGKLRDIHKHLFLLNPEGEKHQFAKMPDVILEKPNDVNGSTCCYDSGFDCLYIRIYGTEGSKLLLHGVSNQEIVYDESTTLARYQSECESPVIDIENVFSRARVMRPSKLALP
jgi:hypothetical protein